MPKPRKNEREDAYVQRCIPIVIKDGTAKDGSQAAAICHSMFRQHHTNSDFEPEVNVGLHSVMIIVNTNYNIRTEQHQGRAHIVVPIVMMTEGVHHGSHGPLGLGNTPYLLQAEINGRMICNSA